MVTGYLASRFGFGGSWKNSEICRSSVISDTPACLKVSVWASGAMGRIRIRGSEPCLYGFGG